jgi:hypothetical protein
MPTCWRKLAKTWHPKGALNRTTQTFREVLLQAVSEVGDSEDTTEDGQGGLLGYLKKCALLERKTTLLLVGRILPLKISTEVKEFRETMTIEEAVADLKKCGLDPMLAFYLQRYPLEPDDENAEWAKLIDTTIDTTIAEPIDVTPEDVTPPKDDTGNDTERQ